MSAAQLPGAERRGAPVLACLLVACFVDGARDGDWAGAGLAFAGVHDSFWTHASSVSQMNEILRASFCDLHSQPLLQNLLAEFQEAAPGADFPPIPEMGDLNLYDVLASPYFFS